MGEITIHCVTEAAKAAGDANVFATPNAIAALITVIGAILAAIVAYFGHLVAKKNAEVGGEVARENAETAGKVARENAILSARLAVNTKLTDLRQTWINNLRADMAEFQAMAVTPDFEFIKEPRFFAIMGRIELSMNRDDPSYKELRELLYSYIDGKRRNDIESYDGRFTRVCQDILKREWDVLKRELTSIAAREATEKISS